MRLRLHPVEAQRSDGAGGSGAPMGGGVDHPGRG